MRVIISSQHAEITDTSRDYVRPKLTRIDRVVDKLDRQAVKHKEKSSTTIKKRVD